MLTAIHPKLPMRNKNNTRNFYIQKLGFQEFGSADFDGYLMLEKEEIQIHFLNLPLWILLKIMGRFTFEPMLLTNCFKRL